MKTLENISTKIKLNGSKTTYADLILDCLNHPPEMIRQDGVPIPVGFSREEMVQRDRIEKIIANNDKEFLFEDSDASNLKKIVGQMRWGIRHPDILKFLDTVGNL